MSWLKSNPVLVLILIAVLVKGLLWWGMVPLWQTPDEQSHFAQLNFSIETNNWIGRGNKDLSREILISEELLGTKRDKFGNNKFTYHPEYKIEYTKTTTGKHEKEIDSIPKAERKQMVGQESAGYPPLYYLISKPLYSLVSNNGLIDRVYTVRLLSVLLNLGLVIVAYLIGRQVWKEKLMAAVLAVMVGFHPMASYVAAGFHPDNLLNLISSVSILICLLILKNKVKLWHLMALGVLGVLGMETKQFMIFMIPGILAVVLYGLFSDRRLGISTAALSLIIPAAAIVAKIPMPYMPRPTGGISFLEYFSFRIPKLMFEIWPWYWGVFKWLGVVFPPLILKVITRLGILAGIGVGVRIFLMWRNRKTEMEEKSLMFFFLISTTYIFYMFLWDWRLMQSNGFSLGLQGRYLFPALVAQMAIIVLGITGLVPEKWEKVRLLAGLVLAVAMISLNVIAWRMVANSYYDTTNRKTFINQLSQYKPQVVKEVLTSF